MSYKRLLSLGARLGKDGRPGIVVGCCGPDNSPNNVAIPERIGYWFEDECYNSLATRVSVGAGVEAETPTIRREEVHVTQVQ